MESGRGACTYDGPLPCWAIPDKHCFGQDQDWRYIAPPSGNEARAVRRHVDLHQQFETQHPRLISLAKACARSPNEFRCRECGFSGRILSKFLNHRCKQPVANKSSTALSSPAQVPLTATSSVPSDILPTKELA